MYLSAVRNVLLATVAAQAVNAHTSFTNFFVDDVPQGDGTCVRMSNDIDKATFPIRPIGAVTGSDMACGKCSTDLAHCLLHDPASCAAALSMSVFSTQQAC